jgi:hypothetical protein
VKLFSPIFFSQQSCPNVGEFEKESASQSNTTPNHSSQAAKLERGSPERRSSVGALKLREAVNRPLALSFG